MSGVTALVNPAIKDDKTINLYFTTTSKQLAVSLESGTDDDSPNKTFEAKSTDYQGYIQVPGEVASDTYRGLCVVAAATVPKGSEDAEVNNNISLVSPVYRPFTKTTKNNVNVAMCATDKQPNQAYIYFLSGTADGSMTIKECTMDSTVTTVSTSSDALYGSSLTAWYDPTTKERCVIYQNYENLHLTELNVVQRQTVNIQNTLDARKGTSVAVSFFEGKVYLYYVANNWSLRRIVRDPVTGWTKASSQKVDGVPPTVKYSTQVSVVQANRINHLFYMSQDDADGAIYHGRDNIDNFKEIAPEEAIEGKLAKADGTNKGVHGHEQHPHPHPSPRHEEQRHGHEQHHPIHEQHYPAHEQSHPAHEQHHPDH